MSESFLNGRVTLHCGDSLDILRTMADCSVDSVCTDPPYALVSIVKRFGKPGSAPAKGDVYARASSGFMGKTWDTGEQAFAVEFWAEVLRVLKPGGHVLAFSGTRTVHRLTCAIEDAGFEIRDMVAWMYGSGFPKSHNQSGEWDGWGTALKPALEPITLARKPLVSTVAANVLALGTGALNIDGCRIAGDIPTSFPKKRTPRGDYVLKAGFHGTAEETAVASQIGRWPANLIHDGSDEVVAAFPATTVNTPSRLASAHQDGGVNEYGLRERDLSAFGGSSGSAARFFYSAKADSDDRLGSKHPTVKPLDLMQYLVRLVTPSCGIVLDPFAGTGTTAEAAWREGMRAIVCEREPEYQVDIRRRMSLCLAGPDERRRAVVKAKAKPDDLSGTLFAPIPSMAAE